MTSPVDIRPDHLEIVQNILHEHLPRDVKVWVFGSRATWTTKDSSDLDLALESKSQLSHKTLGALKDSFENSMLPYAVDVVDLNRIGESFRKIVEMQRVPLPPKETATDRTALTVAADRWHDVTLGDLVEIRHGFAFKGNFIHDEPRGDLLLTPGNFAIGGGFKGDKFKYYDGPVVEEYVLQEGDLIVTMTDLSKQSDTLGYPAVVPACTNERRYLQNQRLGKVVPKEASELHTRFLYYILCSAKYRHEVLASATGTTVKHTSPDRIKQFKFSLPPFPEQRAIAHVLGTLDNKIELNRRMNETLEEMARSLFRSWFVDFDPVRAKMEGRWRAGESLPSLPADLYDFFPDSFVPTELGDIPEGWEVKPLGEVAKISSGKRPDHRFPSANSEAQIPLWGGNGPMGFVSAALIDCPILLTGRVGTLGGVFRITTPCWPSDNTLIVTAPSNLYFGYLFFQMKRIDFDSLNRGSTQPLLTQSDLRAHRIAVPPMNVMESFHDLAGDLLSSSDARTKDSQCLKALRDTLLPKLVTGEMRL